MATEATNTISAESMPMTTPMETPSSSSLSPDVPEDDSAAE
jgi:hypothetical protein